MTQDLSDCYQCGRVAFLEKENKQLKKALGEWLDIVENNQFGLDVHEWKKCDRIRKKFNLPREGEK